MSVSTTILKILSLDPVNDPGEGFIPRMDHPLELCLAYLVQNHLELRAWLEPELGQVVAGHDRVVGQRKLEMADRGTNRFRMVAGDDLEVDALSRELTTRAQQSERSMLALQRLLEQ